MTCFARRLLDGAAHSDPFGLARNRLRFPEGAELAVAVRAAGFFGLEAGGAIFLEAAGAVLIELVGAVFAPETAGQTSPATTASSAARESLSRVTVGIIQTEKMEVKKKGPKNSTPMPYRHTRREWPSPVRRGSPREILVRGSKDRRANVVRRARRE